VSSARDDGQAAERVVIRDKRKIDPSGGKPKETESAEPEQTDEAPAEATKDSAAPDGAAKKERKPSHAAPEPDEEASTVDEPAEEEAEPVESGGPLGAELEALRSELEERTRDLQRVTAEYANYRKRVDRDRGVQAEQATGLVISALLPVLDDLDRAREHGDLVGPFAAVSEQLVAALGKFGLTAFGEKGDPFDPTRHEAVAHRTSSEVTEPTCVEVMRRGYLLGDRLLRAALVAVADPE
jgi:molecular chaperone GrpE